MRQVRLVSAGEGTADAGRRVQRQVRCVAGVTLCEKRFPYERMEQDEDPHKSHEGEDDPDG